MKGFIINLDAVIALSFVLFVMILIGSQSYNPRAPGSIYLKQLTLDTITVLEKTGRIDQAIGGNTSAVQEIVEATPKLACMDVSILNSTESTIAVIVKSDCTETAGLDIQTVTRPVLYQGSKYIIKTESWFRKEPEG